MNYTLAKQLKDAGFPQKENGDNFDSMVAEGYPATLAIEFATKNVTYLTLSELIEACGDGLDNIRNLGNNWLCNYNDEMIDADISSEGKTPEEAVAKLYIELNK